MKSTENKEREELRHVPPMCIRHPEYGQFTCPICNRPATVTYPNKEQR